MASGRDRRYESSASTTECSSSCPSPSTHMPQFGYRPNNAPKYGTMVPNRIFVGGLTAGTTELELMRLFSEFGNVKTTKVINDRAGVSKGYGFVTFETEEEAQHLVQQEAVVLNGRKLNIGPAVKKQPFNPVLGAVPVPPSQPGCIYIPKGSPYMFTNGVICYMPPMAPSQIPAETESTNVPQRNDPVYRSAIIPVSSPGMPPVYPYSRQPLFVPHYQFVPMPQSIDFPFGTSCVSPSSAGFSSANADYSYGEVHNNLENNNVVYGRRGEGTRGNKRLQRQQQPPQKYEKRNVHTFRR